MQRLGICLVDGNVPIARIKTSIKEAVSFFLFFSVKNFLLVLLCMSHVVGSFIATTPYVRVPQCPKPGEHAMQERSNAKQAIERKPQNRSLLNLARQKKRRGRRKETEASSRKMINKRSNARSRPDRLDPKNANARWTHQPPRTPERPNPLFDRSACLKSRDP